MFIDRGEPKTKTVSVETQAAETNIRQRSPRLVILLINQLRHWVYNFRNKKSINAENLENEIRSKKSSLTVKKKCQDLIVVNF
jgi:hypothetical protein